MRLAPGQDLTGLNALRSDAAKGDAQSLKKAAQQFEALLLQQMIKSMRDAVPRAGGDASGAMRQYESMHDQRLALQLSQRGALGLAETIERQLSPLEHADQTADGLRIRHSQFNAIVPAQPQLNEKADRYAAKIRPHAAAAAARLGINPDILIAQSALETGWGEFVPIDDQGKSSNNFFGIKADSRWTGSSVTHRTTEFAGQQAHTQIASFRAYDTVAASFADYADFVGKQPRYQQALEAKTPQAYLSALQQAGYATDPNYAKKVLSLMPRFASPANAVASAGPER